MLVGVRDREGRDTITDVSTGAEWEGRRKGALGGRAQREDITNVKTGAD